MSHPTIFLAEDDAEFRSMLSEYLRSLGYEVWEFPSAEALLDHLRKSGTAAVDLVISDINMGATSGLELVHELKKVRPNLPFILMAAFGSGKIAREAQAAGADAYLDKPFRLPAMKELVQSILGDA